MVTKKVTLCGQQFDVVEQGLDEAQVAACLTEVMAQIKAMSERRDPLTELCQTCEQMDGLLRESKIVLQSAREANFKAVEQEKQRLLKEAYDRARETEAQARQSAQAIRKEAHQTMAAAKGEVESILVIARKQAGELLAMSSQRASAALLEAGERIKTEMVAKLKAQAEEALASKLKIEAQLPAEASAAAEDAEDTGITAQDRGPQNAKPRGDDIYDTRVLLLVHSPKGGGAMKFFHQQLSSLKDIKIAAERGSSENMELTLELDRPMPLKGMLLGLPQVREVVYQGPVEPHRWQHWHSPNGTESSGAKLRVGLFETAKPSLPVPS
jgi:hypothetical protein